MHFLVVFMKQEYKVKYSISYAFIHPEFSDE